MKTTGAVSKSVPSASAALDSSETEAKHDDEIADGLPELVVDTDAGTRAKSNGVGSTDSIDSGLAGDHSSPEHEHGFGAGRSNRRRPRGALKMPPYPGFEWVPSQGVNENGYYYNYDKLSPLGDAVMERECGMETTCGSHIVYVHVNVGETLSVRVGDEVQHIPGPATVRMVPDRHSGPPLPLPLHVPPGHIVQQIVDEYGILRHLVLSPQTPPASSASGPFQMVNMTSGYTSPNVQYLDANGSAPYYDGTYSYAVSPDPSNPEIIMDAGVSAGTIDPNDINGVSPPIYQQNQEFQEPSVQGAKESQYRRPYKQYQSSASGTDDQTRMNGRDGVENYRPVPPRIGGRKKRPPMYRGPNGVLSESNGRYQPPERYSAKSGRMNERNRIPSKIEGAGRNHRAAYNGYSQHRVGGHYATPPEPVLDEPASNPSVVSSHDDEESAKITEMLSRIPPPQVRDISARAAFVQWLPFDCSEASANGGSFPQIDASEFTYEVLLYEDTPEGQPSQNHRCQAELYPQKWLADLKPASDYFVRLRASLEERGITGEPSPAVAFKTKAAQPEKPNPPTVQQRSKTWILLTWQQPRENGSPIGSYHLEIDYGDPAVEGFKEVYSGAALEYKVQNLETSTAYQIRLAASNALGKSEYSDVLTAKTTGGTPSEPEPPSLIESTPSALTLTWKKREGDDEYQLYMEDAQTGYQPILKTRDVVYTVPNLTHATEYRFRLTALNDEGCSPMSKVASFRTAPPKPPAPSKPMAKSVGSDKATIAWEAAGNEAVTYVLEMSDAESKDWLVAYEGKNREFEMTGLEPGFSYRFRLSNRSDGGISGVSDVLELTTMAAPPGCCDPPALKQKPEPTIVRLKWTAPAVCGGSDITDYELSIGQPTGAVSTEVNTDCIIYRGSSASYNVSSGLQPGCTYVFRVRAHNAVGVGPWSPPLECQTSAAPPDSPQRLRLVELTSRSAYLMWEPPGFNNGAPVTAYRLYRAYRKLGSVPSSSAQTPTNEQSPQQPGIIEASIQAAKAPKGLERQESTMSAASDDDCVFSTDSDVGAMVEIYVGSELCFEAQSLTPAVDYAFCVQAINEAGESRLSNALFCRTPADVPDAPITVKPEPVSSSEITVSWDVPADNGSPIVGYHLEVLPAKLEDSGAGLTFPIALPSDCRQYTVENLSPATAYRFRVQAISEIGPGDFSDSVEASTMPPPPPAPKLELASATHNSLKLKWQCDSPTYTLEMENKTGAFSPLATELASRSYKVVRLTESTSYRFRIRASSAMGGVGPWSDSFVFTTLKAPPAAVKYAPKIANITQTSCEIEWQPVKLFSQGNGGDKVHYDLQIRNVASSSNSTEGVFETVYKGPCTTYRLNGLTPGAAYRVRVSSIRVSEAGNETESAPSPISTFSTVPPPSESTPTEDETADGAFGTKVLSDGLNLICGNDRQMSDRQWAMLILVAFSVLALLVAFILQRFIPEGAAQENGGSPVDPQFVNAAAR